MELTKQQTLKHLHLIKKRECLWHRYRFTTKFRWRCLKCMKEIYVRYENVSLKTIFCKECQTKDTTNPNAVQYQYLRKMKEEQLKFVETYMSNFIDSDIIKID